MSSISSRAFSSNIAQSRLLQNHKGHRTRSFYNNEIEKESGFRGKWLPTELVGTGKVPPPLVLALSHPNHTNTGVPVVDLVRPKFRDLKGLRKRTGNPYTDGLVGIEPNPGPPKKTNNRPRKQKIGGMNNTGRARKTGLNNMSGSSVGVAAAVGTIYNPTAPIRSRGSQTVLGSPAHLFAGTCAIQNFYSNSGGSAVFNDGVNDSPFVYMNPRICCQNANYATPLGKCPIGVIAQAFRKFSFRKLRVHYRPTNANTSQSGTMAMAFDPEVITNASLPMANVMSFANFEASVFGPIWQPMTLDLTKWIDKSRWFYGETPSAIGTSLISMQSIQGTLMLCTNILPQNSTIYGMFFLEFELALSELGPTEVFTVPALLSKREEDEDDSSSSSSVAASSSTLPMEESKGWFKLK